jgi:prepilin-type N-terminal cleavage/methylation domain-containing protein
MQLTLRGRDAGFTLIELLIVIVLLGVITVPLAGIVVAFSRNSAATADRLAVSHDAQIAGAYLARDVAGVGLRDYTVASAPSASLPFKPSIELNVAYNAGGRTCGTGATPTAEVRFLADDWDTSTSPATLRTDIVAYYLAAGPSGRKTLHRIKCVGSATPIADATIAHNVDSGSLTVTCSSACGAATLPQSVTLAFTASTPRVPALTVTLTGQRRQA